MIILSYLENKCLDFINFKIDFDLILTFSKLTQSPSLNNKQGKLIFFFNFFLQLRVIY